MKLRMKLRGGAPASRVAGRGELPGRTNYLIGREPENGAEESFASSESSTRTSIRV